MIKEDKPTYQTREVLVVLGRSRVPRVYNQKTRDQDRSRESQSNQGVANTNNSNRSTIIPRIC